MADHPRPATTLEAFARLRASVLEAAAEILRALTRSAGFAAHAIADLERRAAAENAEADRLHDEFTRPDDVTP